jgi:hypothetical protein
MCDIRTAVQQMQRPKLLIHAARMGLSDYRRERDLRRLGYILLRPELALLNLLEAESRIEQKRLSGEAGYSLAQHVDVLIALMGEVQFLPKAPA